MAPGGNADEGFIDGVRLGMLFQRALNEVLNGIADIKAMLQSEGSTLMTLREEIDSLVAGQAETKAAIAQSASDAAAASAANAAANVALKDELDGLVASGVQIPQSVFDKLDAQAASISLVDTHVAGVAAQVADVQTEVDPTPAPAPQP